MITPWTNEVLVNESTTGSQVNPNTTTLTNGNVVITWSDADGDDTIYFKIYDTEGNVVLGETAVNNTLAEPIGSYPYVEALANGGFVIGHQSVNTLTGIDSAVLTVFDAAGTETNEVSVAAGATATVDKMSIVSLSNGNVMVVYKDPTSGNVFNKVYDSSFVLQSTTQVNVGTNGTSTEAVSATLLSNGNVAIVWEASSSTEYQIVDGGGVPSLASDGVVDGDIYGVPKVIAAPTGGL